MAKFVTVVQVETDEPLSRRDLADMGKAVESTVTGSGGQWDPEDFSGEVTEVRVLSVVSDDLS